MSNAFLADKPRFADVAGEFLEFVQGAELVIHNAAFDVGFLDAELARLEPPGPPVGELCGILDTLMLARQLHPGQRNSLDALCKRYEVDNSSRKLHGALLDAEPWLLRPANFPKSAPGHGMGVFSCADGAPDIAWSDMIPRICASAMRASASSSNSRGNRIAACSHHLGRATTIERGESQAYS